MKEIFADAALGGMWTARNPWQVSRTGINGITPGSIDNYIGIVEMSSPDLIVVIGVAPPCGLNLSQEVGNKQQSTSPSLVRQYQKLDAAVDKHFSDNCNLTSIFSKVISEKNSDGSRQDIYTHCRMDLTEDPVQTQTPQFVDLGLPTINSLDEGSGISTPPNIIRRPMDGSHWSTPNNTFGETKSIGLIEAKFDYEYNYKTYFQIWK